MDCTPSLAFTASLNWQRVGLFKQTEGQPSGPSPQPDLAPSAPTAPTVETSYTNIGIGCSLSEGPRMLHQSNEQDKVRPQALRIQQVSRVNTIFNVKADSPSLERFVSQIVASHHGFGSDVDITVTSLLSSRPKGLDASRVTVVVESYISGQLTYSADIKVSRFSEDDTELCRNRVSLPSFIVTNSSPLSVGTFDLLRRELVVSRLKTEARPLVFLLHPLGNAVLSRRMIIPIISMLASSVEFKMPADVERLTSFFETILLGFSTAFPRLKDTAIAVNGLQFVCLQIMPMGIDSMQKQYVKEDHSLALRVSVYSSPTCPIEDVPRHALEIGDLFCKLRDAFNLGLPLEEMHLFKTLVRPYPLNKGAYIDISPDNRETEDARLYNMLPSGLLRDCNLRDKGIRV